MILAYLYLNYIDIYYVYLYLELIDIVTLIYILKLIYILFIFLCIYYVFLSEIKIFYSKHIHNASGVFMATVRLF